MNPSADAADQIVRVSMNGTKYIVRVASKQSKEAAEKLARAMIAAMKQKNKKVGSMRKGNLIKSGIRLDIADISISDIRRFAAQAKKYGVLYTIVKDKSSPDGSAQLMYRANDKEKVNMIFQHIGRPTEFYDDVRESITKDLKDRPAGEKKVKDLDTFVDELMGKPEPERKDEPKSEKKPAQASEQTNEDNAPEDPTQGNPSQGSRSRSRRTKRNPSEITSERESRPASGGFRRENDQPERRSVREELAEIKRDMERKAQQDRNRTRTITHKNPGKKKKPKKEKER